MKKKMTVLGGLLLAALVSAYSVCGTYAKYISGVDAADEARVAKWSFGAGSNTTAIEDLFAASYSKKNIAASTYTYTLGLNTPVTGLTSEECESRKTTNGAGTCTEVKPTGGNTDPELYVKSLNGDDVVAPGTSGSYTFNISGEMETNFTLKLNVSGYNNVTLTKFEAGEVATADAEGANDIAYSPIKFTLTKIKVDNKTEVVEDKVTFTALTTKINELLKAAADAGKDGEDNTVALKTDGTVNASGKIDGGTYRIDWEWAYVTGTTKEEKDQNNKYDTLLGNKVVESMKQVKVLTDAITGKTGDALTAAEKDLADYKKSSAYKGVSFKAELIAEQTQCPVSYTVAADGSCVAPAGK